MTLQWLVRHTQGSASVKLAITTLLLTLFITACGSDGNNNNKEEPPVVVDPVDPVSYTHLTLPTSDLV